MNELQSTSVVTSVKPSGPNSRIPPVDFDRALAAGPSITDSVRRPVAAPVPERIIIDADEVTFRVGSAVLSLTRENGGTLEIRAAHVRIRGDSIVSEATGTNAVVGEHVVAEAEMHADLLGKLIRIDGQCVKINS